MSGSGPIRAVGFDLDGTLYRSGPLKRRMALALAGLPLRRGPRTARRVLRVLRRFRHLHEELRDGLARGGVPLDRFHHLETARRVAEPLDFVEGVVDEWMRRRPLPALPACAREGLHECLAGLREAGIRVGVLSDYPVRAKLAALRIDGLVDAAVAATDPDVDALKPSPRGFEVLAARLGVPAGEALYVGDRTEVDGAGAGAAGWRFLLVGAGAGAVRDLGEVLERVLGTRS